jgi:hypothetical protein
VELFHILEEWVKLFEIQDFQEVLVLEDLMGWRTFQRGCRK